MRIEDLKDLDRCIDRNRMILADVRTDAIIFRVYVRVNGHWKANETSIVTKGMVEFVRAQLDKLDGGDNRIKSLEIAAKISDDDARQVFSDSGLLINRITDLEKAAQALVDKINIIHEDGEYNAVWLLAQMHRGPYKGPQYDDELETLKSVLKRDGQA